MDFLIKDGVLLRYTRKYASQEIIVPEGIREIGKRAFSEVKNIRHIRLPDSLERIGDYAFSECRTLMEIVIPAGVRHIGRGAFYRCRSVREAKLPEALSELSPGLFSFPRACWKSAMVLFIIASSSPKYLSAAKSAT